MLGLSKTTPSTLFFTNTDCSYFILTSDDNHLLCWLYWKPKDVRHSLKGQDGEALQTEEAVVEMARGSPWSHSVTTENPLGSERLLLLFE